MKELREYAIQCIKDEAEAVLGLIPQLDESFDTAVDLIYNCKGKIIVTGVGKSGHIGAKIAATLSSTGTPSFFINPLDVFHGDLGVMAQEDVVLAISNSGQTDELLRFIPMVLHMQIPIIGMSGNPASLLAKYSTCHLNVSVEKERNFQPRDFAQYHPGGELGKRLLTTAQDVMRSDDLPVLPPEMHLGEAIILVSKGKLGLGVAEVEGKIVGLITDGDIRRATEKWQAQFFDRTVSDIMTRTPKTVRPETKISEIQQIMNRYKIHSVLVTDDEQHLLGVVDHYSCMI